MPAEQRLTFITRVMEIFSLTHADTYDELFWRVDDGHLRLYVNVSDVFDWGGADAEEITPESLTVLERAFADLRPLGATCLTPTLYAARQRQHRPQGAAYPGPTDPSWRETSALLDGCGPARETGLGNPRNAPAHKEAS